MQAVPIIEALRERATRDAARPASAAPMAGLSPLERQAVAIGQTDARNGGPAARSRLLGRIWDIACRVAGWRRAKALANPRLELLRSFAQLAALERERIGDIRAMRDAGFTSLQIVTAARLARAR